LNPWRGLSGLPRALWILAAASFVNRSGTMFLPFLILYLTKEMGVATSTAGAVFALFGVGALTAGPVVGRLADRFGPVRMMRISLVSSGVLLFCVPLARSLGPMAVLTFLIAVTNEAFRRGADLVTLEASSFGEHTYARMGYREIYRYRMLIRL